MTQVSDAIFGNGLTIAIAIGLISVVMYHKFTELIDVLKDIRNALLEKGKRDDD